MKRALKKGFTLVEMLVAISIFVIFSALVLADYKDFGRNQKFLNFVYDVALIIRQVQTSGLAVLESRPTSQNFNIGYGVHFDTDINKSFVIFGDDVDSDNVRNGTYDQPQEFLQRYNLDQGFWIKQICGIASDGTENCSTSNSFLDIVFVRPNPDALINYNGDKDNYKAAKIYLASPYNVVKSIYVNAAGQISVE